MSKNTKIANYNKYVTLNNLKDFYKLLNKNFAATEEFYGGIKIGYSQNNKNYPVQLENGKAYVNVPWTSDEYSLPAASDSVLGGIKTGYFPTAYNKWAVKVDGGNAYATANWNFGTGIATETFANSSSMTVKASLVSDDHNEKDSSKTNSANTNRFYPVELDKSGKLAVTVPWVNTVSTIYTGKEGVNISSSNEIALDLYKKKSTTQGSNGLNVDVYNPITLSTAIPGSWEETNAEKIYPVVFDKNNNLSVLVKWANTWQENKKNQAGYVKAPTGNDGSKVWMTDSDGNPAWRTLPEQTTGSPSTTTIPEATKDSYGGIKIGYTSNDNKYAVELNGSGQAFVTVPSTGSSSVTCWPGATTTSQGTIMLGYEPVNKGEYALTANENFQAYVNVPWYTAGTGIQIEEGQDSNEYTISVNVLKKDENSNITTEPVWSTGTDIPANSEYYSCPIYVDKNGRLFVKVPVVKSDSSSGGVSPINDNE